jgi:hypothetical protein
MRETIGSQAQVQKPATMALQAKFNQGLALHQQGNLTGAERIRFTKIAAIVVSRD